MTSSLVYGSTQPAVWQTCSSYRPPPVSIQALSLKYQGTGVSERQVRDGQSATAWHKIMTMGRGNRLSFSVSSQEQTLGTERNWSGPRDNAVYSPSWPLIPSVSLLPFSVLPMSLSKVRHTSSPRQFPPKEIQTRQLFPSLTPALAPRPGDQRHEQTDRELPRRLPSTGNEHSKEWP